MKLATFAWYVAATGGVLCFLWVAGLPVRLAMAAVDGETGSAVATPVLALFPLTVCSWYLLQTGHAVADVPVVLGVVAVAATGLLAAVRVGLRRRPFEPHRVRVALNRLPTAITVFAVNMVVSLFTLGTVYARGSRTVVSLGNNDIANYAFHAQHILDRGVRPGPIVGFDIAAADKGLETGADSILTSVASVLRTDTMHVLHLTTLVAVFLGVYGLVRLLTERLGVSRPCAILAAQSAYGVFFVAYLQGQYFLSQLLAMALLPAFLALLIDVARSGSWRTWAAGVIGMGALSAAGIAIYPQLALVSAAIFVPAAVFGRRAGQLIHSLVRTAGAMACGIALGAAVAPSLSHLGWDISVQVAGVKAGWPLHRLFLTDMLGFQTSDQVHHSAVAWVVSGAILAGLGWTTWWLWRRRDFAELTAFGPVAIGIIVSSDLAVFWYEGVSYQQWKWVTFLIPLFVALFLAQTLSALSLIDHPMVHGLSASRAAGGCYLLAVTALAAPVTFPLAVSTPTYLMVSADAAAVANSPMVKALPALNIHVSPYWDTMWLAYFLRHKDLYLLSRSYFPTQKPQADWTIERNDSPATAAQVIRLNATYRLVRQT